MEVIGTVPESHIGLQKDTEVTDFLYHYIFGSVIPSRGNKHFHYQINNILPYLSAKYPMYYLKLANHYKG